MFIFLTDTRGIRSPQGVMTRLFVLSSVIDCFTNYQSLSHYYLRVERSDANNAGRIQTGPEKILDQY